MKFRLEGDGYFVKKLVQDAEKGVVGKTHSTNDFGYQWYVMPLWKKVCTVLGVAVFLPITLPIALITIVVPMLLGITWLGVQWLFGKREWKA